MVQALELAIVFVLSAIPFIECRGAMFFGFSVGITDIQVYILCSAMNIAQALLYPRLFASRHLAKNGFLKVASKAALECIPEKIAPPFFLVGIPAFGNGINTFTSSLVSHLLKIKGAFPYIAGGIVLRDALTFLLLSGASFIVGPGLLQDAAQLAFIIYFLCIVYWNRAGIMKLFGLKIAPGSALCLFGFALMLSLAAAVLLNQEVAVAAERLFSLVYPARSDGKMLVFLAMLAAFFLVRWKIAPAKKGAGAANWQLPALFALLALLAAISLLATLAIVLDFQQGAIAAGFHPFPAESQMVEAFEFHDGYYMGYDLSSYRLNHNHILKAAAFLPLSYAWPGLGNVYSMGFGAARYLPYSILFLAFFLIIALVILAYAICARLKFAESLLFMLLFFEASAALVDAGPISPRFLCASLAMALLLNREKGGWLGAVALLLAIAFVNFHFFGTTSGYLLSIPILAFCLAAAYSAARRKFLLSYALVLLAAIIGFSNPSAQITVAMAAGAVLLMRAGLNEGRVVLLLFLACAAIDLVLGSLETMLLPALLLSPVLFLKGNKAEKIAFALIFLAAFSYFAPTALSSPQDNFQPKLHGRDFLVYVDGQAAASSFREGVALQKERLGEQEYAFLVRNYTGESLLDAFDGNAPKPLQYGYVCPSQKFVGNEAFAILDSPCKLNASHASAAYSGFNTVVRLSVLGEEPHCLVLIESSGDFANCRVLQLLSLRKFFPAGNLSGRIGGGFPPSHVG